MKRVIILIAFVLLSLSVKAQDKIAIDESDYTNEEVPMADRFREEGKIYVLTGVIVLILAGIIVYLITIDRKVAKLEKQLENDDA